jgi:putative Mn2+ efflux pump MntP
MQMGLLAVLATAVSIAMDAFSVSICVGIADRASKNRVRTALILGAAFGFFQFVMPLLGAKLAGPLSRYLGHCTPWAAVFLIVWVAGKMIWETYRSEGDCSSMSLSVKNVLILAFATSLDALAVGFSIESAGGSACLLATSAGVVTFALSLIGGLFGASLGEKMGEHAQYFGAAVLLMIAARIAYMAL